MNDLLAVSQAYEYQTVDHIRTAQVNMIRHDFHAQNLEGVFPTHLKNNLLEPCIYWFHKYFSAILGAPDHMIFARIEHILV